MKMAHRFKPENCANCHNFKIDSSQSNPYYFCKKHNRRISGIDNCNLNNQNSNNTHNKIIKTHNRKG